MRRAQLQVVGESRELADVEGHEGGSIALNFSTFLKIGVGNGLTHDEPP